MTEKGCDNCYYSFFDERAYPCSLCIRGVERTDQWQPSKKTKAEQTEPFDTDTNVPCKTEPQQVASKLADTVIPTDIERGVWDYKGKGKWAKTEPQTDCADTNLSEKPTDSERSE